MRKIIAFLLSLLSTGTSEPVSQSGSAAEINVAEQYYGGLSNSEIFLPFQASALCDHYFYPEEKDAYLRCFRYAELPNNVRYALYDNGGGDEIMIIQKGESVLIKGFSHESEVSPYAREDNSLWPGMYDGVPEEFMAILQELSSEQYDRVHQVTFCFFRKNEHGTFVQGVKNLGNIDDGSEELMDNNYAFAISYIDYAKGYYSSFTEEDSVKIQAIYASLGIPLSGSAGIVTK